MSASVRKHVEAVFGVVPDAAAGAPGRVRASVARAAGTRVAKETFSVFRPADAVRAADFAGELSRIAEGAGPEAGLEEAAAAAAEMARSNPGLARHALGLFATHHPLGRRTPIPALLKRTALRAAVNAREAQVTLGSASTGAETALDWFREDPLANEHHEHWHWVYPNHPPAGKPVKERHGELFYYMHQQMLARYDAERAAAGLARVQPLEDFDGSIGEGYDPGLLKTLDDYEPRAGDASMADSTEYDRATLTQLARRLTTAARNRRLGTAAESVALEGHAGSDLLGHEAEPTASGRFPQLYGWHHGMGHMLISDASRDKLGVMRNTETAIRDPAFWRWHRHVDDIHFLYQDSLEPHVFGDVPPLAIRRLTIESEDTGRVPADQGAAVELRTRMRSGVYQLLDGKQYLYDFLVHEPFRIRIELANSTAAAVPVTLRLFLIPNALFDVDADPKVDGGRQMRRFAIELDKVKIDAPPGDSSHVRHGRDMSVIRRPAVVDPVEVVDLDGGNSDEASQECTCGWPFGLLLPRGTADGMPLRVFAMLTDNRLDRIGSPKPCGSMSFCGAGEGYPDAKPMGYPFDRPLERPLRALVDAHPGMALQDIVIRWTNPPGTSSDRD